MQDYRIYCIDDVGRIILADWIDANSDEEAALEARLLRLTGHKCELWHLARLVAKFNTSGVLEAIEP